MGTHDATQSAETEDLILALQRAIDEHSRLLDEQRKLINRLRDDMKDVKR